MKRWCRVLGALALIGGAAGAAEVSYATTPESNVYIVKQQRGMFNTVRVNRDLPRQTCGGATPISVEVFHTVGDGIAAVMTGILYTPAHLRVTCPAR